MKRLPPVSFFVVSAIFHYLGPSLAVLLFARIAAPGVLWLRIFGAAVVFADGGGRGGWQGGWTGASWSRCSPSAACSPG